MVGTSSNITAGQVAAPRSGLGSSTCTVVLTGTQIFGFADLVRRLGRAYGPDAKRSLRQELHDALNTFVALLPEPSDEDVDVYLAAVQAGELPNWGMDELPLAETTTEWVARVHPQHAMAHETQGFDAVTGCHDAEDYRPRSGRRLQFLVAVLTAWLIVAGLGRRVHTTAYARQCLGVGHDTLDYDLTVGCHVMVTRERHWRGCVDVWRAGVTSTCLARFPVLAVWKTARALAREGYFPVP
jgi:hypothetical protein